MNLKKISEGAESYIYSTDMFKLDSILKRRSIKKYRLKEIDESIRVERTRNEARIMGSVASLNINAPKVLLVGKYDIYMNRIYGKNMNLILDSKETITKNQFETLGKYAAILHSNGIVHGDYTPANVMIGKNGVISIIDFGLSEITDSMEDKALDILLMKRSISKDQFKFFLQGYKTHCKDNALILKRLSEIEKRGRYNTRTLIT